MFQYCVAFIAIKEKELAKGLFKRTLNIRIDIRQTSKFSNHFPFNSQKWPLHVEHASKWLTACNCRLSDLQKYETFLLNRLPNVSKILPKKISVHFHTNFGHGFSSGCLEICFNGITCFLSSKPLLQMNVHL